MASSKRPERMAAQLREEISRLVARDLTDPRLEGLIVSNVTFTSDLQLAKVFWRLAIVPMPGVDVEARRKETEQALERASGRVRRSIAASMKLRVAPEIRFQYDQGQEKRDRIDELLEEVKRETKS